VSSRLHSLSPISKWICSRVRASVPVFVVTTAAILPPRRGQVVPVGCPLGCYLFDDLCGSVKLTSMVPLTLPLSDERNRVASSWYVARQPHRRPDEPRFLELFCAGTKVHVNQWCSPHVWLRLYCMVASGSGLSSRCFTGVVASEGRCLARATKGCSLLLLAMGTCSSGR
jgi:hypothetical protein